MSRYIDEVEDLKVGTVIRDVILVLAALIILIELI